MIARTTQRLQRQARHAFTLMEMLVVVAIIVVLAGIGGFYLMPQLDKSKEQAAKAQAKVIEQAAQSYYQDNGQYPSSVQDLTQPSPHLNNRPYLSDDAILDPWGKPYTIDPTGPNNKGGKPDVYTKSPTGTTIGNWGK
jgi:general secretion pathway protein G